MLNEIQKAFAQLYPAGVTNALAKMAEQFKDDDCDAMLCSIFKWTVIYETGNLAGDNPSTCALCCAFTNCTICPVSAFLDYQGSARTEEIACYDTPFGPYSDSANADADSDLTLASAETIENAAKERAFLIQVFEWRTSETFDESVLEPFYIRYTELTGAKF